MDLKSELINVLESPSRFWDAMVQNLAREPRVCLLTLATCKLPISLVDWQEAVARVSTDAAVKFEAAIRVLDDNFVVITRDRLGEYVINFRNPSVEEFVAAQLDANVGFAKTVAEAGPSLNQVQRLLQLGTGVRRVAGAERGPSARLYEFVYPSINKSLLHTPTALVNRMFKILPAAPGPELRSGEDVLTLVQLLGNDSLARLSDADRVRERLSAHLLDLSFDRPQGIIYKLLDDERNAQTIHATLGELFERFYDNLADTAASLGNYDSLVNLDEALGRSPKDASWAVDFHRKNQRWLDSTDADDVESEREMYEKVGTYLQDLSGLDEWDDLLEASRDSRSVLLQPDDESWRDSGYDPPRRQASPRGSGSPRPVTFFDQAASQRGQIDAMFEGLSRTRPDA